MTLRCNKCRRTDRLISGPDWIVCLNCGSEDIREDAPPSTGLFQWENTARRRPLADARTQVEAASGHIRARYRELPPIDSGEDVTSGVGWPD